MRSQEHQTILLVEDEALIAMVGAKAIKDFGYQVIIAHSGEKAVQIALENETINLILMDINLGDGIDGTEAARQILSKRTLPIVFHTSHTEREYVDKVERITSYGYVIKNSGDFVLQASIEMALRLFNANIKTQESELRYRSLIECSSDAISCVDEKGQYRFTNHLFASTLGRTPDYFIGKTIWDIYPEEHAAYRYEATKRVFQTGESESLEVEVPLPDRTLYFHATANPIKDETGKVVLVLTYATDITKRKQVEEELRVHQTELSMQNEELRRTQLELEISRNRYFDLYELAPVGYITVNEKGLILEANLTAASLLGVAQGTLIQQPFSRFILKEDQGIYDRYHEELFETGAAKCELRIVIEDYLLFWVHLEATEAQDINGKEMGRVSMIDITDRKHSEKLLEDSENKYRTLYESSRDGIVRIDMEGRFVECNSSYLEMVGYTSEELVGRSYKEITPTQWETEEDRIVSEQTIGRGYSDVYEKEYKCKDGGIINVTQRSYLIKENGKSVGMWGLIRDITERKRLEDEVRFQSEIITNMAEALFLVRMDDGVIVYTNTLFEKMFGYEHNEMIGKHVSIVNAPAANNPEDTAKEMMSIISQEGFWQGEVLNIRKDGTPFWCYASVSLFHHSKYGDVIVTIHTDITDCKHTENELKESEEKYRSLFASMISGFALFEMIYDDEGRPIDCRYIDVNPAHEKLTGLKKEAIIGRTARESFPGLEDYWIVTYGRVDKAGIPEYFENYAEGLNEPVEKPIYTYPLSLLSPFSGGHSSFPASVYLTTLFTHYLT